MSAYMRHRFTFYGISAPLRRELFKPLIKKAKVQKKIDWEFLEKVWQEDEREMQYFVLDYLRACQRFLTAEDLANLEKLARSKQWWDSIDNLARTLGNLLLSQANSPKIMLEWSTDHDFWIRRIAIIHQLGYKKKTDTSLLEAILVSNFGSDQFFINKAIGWALRDYSKSDPTWVRDFLNRHDAKLSNLSKKEAEKYL